MSQDRLRIDETNDGAVVELTIGPAPANILSMKTCDALDKTIDRLARSTPRTKLIVIRGDGKHFSFGASIEEHQADQVGEMLPRFHGLIRRILACPIPTLARVSGQCLGGGFELALACSLVFADENARLGVPEIKLGVFPPPAAILLPHRVPEAIANEIVLTGESFDARTLHARGVVNKIADEGQLDRLVQAFIDEQILPKSASSLRLAMRALRTPLLRHWSAEIATAERLYLDELMHTPDANEGIAAFIEKRSPRWCDDH